MKVEFTEAMVQQRARDDKQHPGQITLPLASSGSLWGRAQDPSIGRWLDTKIPSLSETLCVCRQSRSTLRPIPCGPATPCGRAWLGWGVFLTAVDRGGPWTVT